MAPKRQDPAFFQEVDKLLNDILASFPDYELFIISDHGFHGPATYDFYINSWLKIQGYLKLKGNKAQQWLIQQIYRLLKSRSGKILLRCYKEVSKLISVLRRSFSKKVYEHSHPNYMMQHRFPWGVDERNTVAIAIDSPPGIRIIRENLRESWDYERLRDELINKLQNLNKNGEKIFEEVWRREDIYKGKYLNLVPDIVYLALDKFDVVTSTIPRSVFSRRKPGRIGRHEKARDGMFLAFGRFIREGLKLIKSVDITDVAPTILYFFGVPVPEDMDGRVLVEIFKDNIGLSQEKVIRYKVSEKVLLKRKIKKLKNLLPLLNPSSQLPRVNHTKDISKEFS